MAQALLYKCPACGLSLENKPAVIGQHHSRNHCTHIKVKTTKNAKSKFDIDLNETVDETECASEVESVNLDSGMYSTAIDPKIIGEIGGSHYLNLQETFINQTYGSSCLFSSGAENYLSEVSVDPANSLLIKISLFGEKASLSRALGDELLQLIEECRGSIKVKLPKAWKSIQNYISRVRKPFS